MSIDDRVKTACATLLAAGHKLNGKTTVVLCDHAKGCPCAVRPAPCTCTPRITFLLPTGKYRVDPEGNVSNPASVN